MLEEAGEVEGVQFLKVDSSVATKDAEPSGLWTYMTGRHMKHVTIKLLLPEL